MKAIGYVYITKNLLNNKIYIGQHRSVSYDEKYYGSGTIINYALRKHGKENFFNSVIEWCYSQEELNEKEEHYIKIYNSLTPIGYNIRFGGSQSKLNETSRMKISKAHMGKKLSNDHKRKISIGVLRTGVNKNKKILYGKNNPMFGVSVKERMKSKEAYESWKLNCSRHGKQNGMYGKPLRDRFGSEEAFENWKLSCANHGKKNGMFGKPSPGRKAIIGLHKNKEYRYASVREWGENFKGVFDRKMLKRYLDGKNTKINKLGWQFYYELEEKINEN